MKRISALLIVSIALFVISCSSSKQANTGVWVNKEKIQGKSFDSVFIVVMTANIESRVRLENDLAAAAKKRGLVAVKSMDIIPPSLSNPAAPTKEEIVSKVKSTGCDAVFIASMLKQEEEVRYVPGSTSYTIMPTYTWSGNYYGYYNHYYIDNSTPSSYDQKKNYFIQSNLYDVASEEIMWSVQSEVFNPSSLDKFSKSYTSSLIKQLEDEGLLKKKK